MKLAEGMAFDGGALEEARYGENTELGRKNTLSSVQFKNKVAKELKALGYTVSIKSGHGYFSGFINNGDKFAYVNITDEGQYLYRTAKDAKDYSGGSNQFAKNVEGMVSGVQRILGKVTISESIEEDSMKQTEYLENYMKGYRGSVNPPVEWLTERGCVVIMDDGSVNGKVNDTHIQGFVDSVEYNRVEKALKLHDGNLYSEGVQDGEEEIIVEGNVKFKVVPKVDSRGSSTPLKWWEFWVDGRMVDTISQNPNDKMWWASTVGQEFKKKNELIDALKERWGNGLTESEHLPKPPAVIGKGFEVHETESGKFIVKIFGKMLPNEFDSDEEASDFAEKKVSELGSFKDLYGKTSAYAKSPISEGVQGGADGTLFEGKFDADGEPVSHNVGKDLVSPRWIVRVKFPQGGSGKSVSSVEYVYFAKSSASVEAKRLQSAGVDKVRVGGQMKEFEITEIQVLQGWAKNGNLDLRKGQKVLETLPVGKGNEPEGTGSKPEGTGSEGTGSKDDKKKKFEESKQTRLEGVMSLAEGLID